MPMTSTFESQEPTREQLDTHRESLVVEFGVPWCGHCQAAQKPLAEAFAGHPGVTHLKIEDGKGCRLGRSFKVKLWPTLIFMKDGQEVERLVRPSGAAEIERVLARIDTAS